jgi:hypothetical protein
VVAAGSAQTKIQKKARRTPQDLPRAADGPSDAQGAPPVAPIDLTGEISTTVAPPPTLSQGGEQEVDPELAEVRSWCIRWGKRPRTPVKARSFWPGQYEDLRDPVWYVARTIEADRAFEEEQAKLKAKEKALEEGQPAPNPLRDGRATPDRWDDSDEDQHGTTPVDIPEFGSSSEWPTRPNSEQGEEGEDFVF